MVNLEGRLNSSEKLIEWLDEKLNGYALQNNDRTRLSASCLYVASEHHKAIVLMIRNSLFGSAMTMLRPAFEAYIKGVWLHRCAMDMQLDSFNKGKFDSKFNKMIIDLQKILELNSGYFGKIKEKLWPQMCDFTHTGLQQVIRHIKSETIEPSYKEEDLIVALQNADIISYGCALEFANLTDDSNLAGKIWDRLKNL